MGALLERLGVERPVIQAGMGGGLAGSELAAAVSEAGGLGTIGILAPSDLRDEIAAARRLTARPVAVNLLLPFARRPHFEAAEDADVVVTFWGRPKRRTAKTWIHQCGSVEEALAAHDAGADAVIAQGVEAGGHVRGNIPALELLARVRAALPDGYPVLSAGGIAEAADTRARLDAGAEAVVCGTRFLMSEESGGHPDYKAAPDRSAGDAPDRAVRRRLAGSAPGRPERGDRRAGSRATPAALAGCALIHRATAPAFARVAAFVYMLRCGDGTLYCGWTNDVPRRLAQHQDGTASRYTRARLPVELAWSRPKCVALGRHARGGPDQAVAARSEATPARRS